MLEKHDAATGGGHATMLTLLWWLEGGAVNRVPVVQTSQEVALPGIAGMTHWQVEGVNETGTVLSGDKTYLVD